MTSEAEGTSSAPGRIAPHAGTGLTLDLVGWDEPDAERLRTAQQAELRALYGDDDIGHTMTGASVLAMVVLRLDGTAIGCGAVRDASDELGAGVGELKRMYVVPAQRGHGWSRLVLADLEARARVLGLTRLVLETGVLQVEALGLYLGAGYLPIENFGQYADVAESRCLAKSLVPEDARPVRAAVRPAGPAPVVTIRRAAWDDPDAVRLRREMFDEASLPRYPELAHLVATPGGYEADDAAQGVGVLVVLVADVDGVPRACVALRAARPGLEPDAGELKKVFVSEAARGLGIARLLMRAVEGEARLHGLARLVLHTGIRQPEAITLYTALGYRPVRLFPQHAGDPIALCFGKLLA